MALRRPGSRRARAGSRQRSRAVPTADAVRRAQRPRFGQTGSALDEFRSDGARAGLVLCPAAEIGCGRQCSQSAQAASRLYRPAAWQGRSQAVGPRSKDLQNRHGRSRIGRVEDARCPSGSACLQCRRAAAARTPRPRACPSRDRGVIGGAMACADDDALVLGYGQVIDDLGQPPGGIALRRGSTFHKTPEASLQRDRGFSHGQACETVCAKSGA